MSKPVTEILHTVAHGLHLSEAEVLQQGLRSLLEHQLREVKAEIVAISGRYGVSSVEEMEARYREGTLEEADSWRDLQPQGAVGHPAAATQEVHDLIEGVVKFHRQPPGRIQDASCATSGTCRTTYRIWQRKESPL